MSRQTPVNLRLSRHQMVSSTDLPRRFGEYLDRATQRSEPIFVTRNNSIEAVVLGIEDYERLTEYEELVEHLIIAQLVKDRADEPEVTDLETLLREEGTDEDELQKSDPN